MGRPFSREPYSEEYSILPAPFIVYSRSWTSIVHTSCMLWPYGISKGVPTQKVWQNKLQRKRTARFTSNMAGKVFWMDKQQ